MEGILNAQEMRYLAMNFVGKELEKEGFEFLTVNSKLKKDPQFVCLKNKKTHFVIVRAIIYPEDPTVYDTIYMETVKQHALKFNAKTYYAGIGLTNATDPQKPIFKNEKYIIQYTGLIEI